MNKLFLSGAVALGLMATPALANDVEAHCEALTSGEGKSSEPCSCVGDVAAGDQAVADAVLALGSTDEAEGMDDSVKEALAVCFPQD
jgi:hypothetical protein